MKFFKRGEKNPKLFCECAAQFTFAKFLQTANKLRLRLARLRGIFGTSLN